MRRRVPLLLGLLIALAATLGLAWAGPAQGAGPTAIAVDSNGIVYSGYASGGTIQRNRGTDGGPLPSWGTAGNADGLLGGIVAIDVAPGDSGRVWILDTNRRVQEFTRSGTYVRGFQLEPCAAAINPNPNLRGGLDVTDDAIYVVHPCRDKIYRFARSNLVEKAWAADVAGPLKGASAQLYDTAPAASRYLYVTRPTRNDVVWFDLNSLAWHGPRGVGGSPTDVFVDAYGVLFVSEKTNDLIRLFAANGNEFRKLGGTGGALGKLRNPGALDVFEQFSDLAGNLFIADTGNERIQRWDPFGYTFWGATANGSPTTSAPANTAIPEILGSPEQGEQVSCSDGSWTGAPTSFAYRWARNGTGISGATGQDYTITAADVGESLTCLVIATNSAGSTAAASEAVIPSASSAPANTAPPEITGNAVVGETLSCSQGSWTGGPTSYVFRWRRSGSAIATGPDYTITNADVGAALTCQVQASNANGTGSALSDPVTPTATPADGEVGVTINDAALATDSPGVTLTIHEPAGATAIRISNDGGFGDADTVAIRGDDSYAWTLRSGGAERLPRTVYVRFSGPGVDPARTFSDDIILDETAPTLRSASLRGRALTVKARDGASGLGGVEYAKRKKAKRTTKLAYRTRLRVRRPARVRWARVIDNAGNPSAWKRVERRR